MSTLFALVLVVFALPLKADEELSLPAHWAIRPVTEHPYLLFGPESKSAESARLTKEFGSFDKVDDPYARVYFAGDEAAKKKATADWILSWKTYAKRWRKDNLEDRVDWLDGVALRGVRRTLITYDLVASYGYLTPDQTREYRDTLVRTIEFAIGHDSAHPRITTNDAFRTMNIWTDTVAAAGLVGLAFPELPQAHDWVEFAVREINTQLTHYVWDGAWHESPRYHCATLEMTGVFFAVLERRTGVNFFENPHFKGMVEWPTRFQTPLDRPSGIVLGHPEGVALLPGIGDSSWVNNSLAVPALFASHYAQSDPQLAGRIMWTWQRAGRPWVGDSVEFAYFLIDPTIKPVPRVLGDDLSPGKGYVLMHSGADTPEDIWFLLRCGKATRSTYHDHADWNAFNIYAYGAPLAIDSASGAYSDPSHLHWNDRAVAHNTVVFGGRSQDRRDGRIIQWVSRPDLDYSVTDATLAADTGKFIRHVLYVKAGYFVVWDEIVSIDPTEWMLHTPATKFEWSDHGVRCITPWQADLDVQVVWPTGALKPGTQKGRYSDWTAKQLQRDSHPFQYLDYFSVANPPSADFLVVLHPVKPGSPNLVVKDVGKAGAPALDVTVNGRTDHIELHPETADIRIGSAEPVHLAR